MNLLPRPRQVDLSDDTVPAAIPTVAMDTTLPPQGYRLRITADGVVVEARDGAGSFYGRATLDQLGRIHDGRLPVGTVTDWPDLPVRGVMLDISRDKVPTRETLLALVERLAGWKINQLQLYTEHTFAYRNHRDVWEHASPITPDDVRVLDEHCRRHHVELVPNQNCLGHFNRWLSHERYRHLAIAPDGFVDPYGRRQGPMTIEPKNPESLALVRGLLSELLPYFTSERIHVGLDEAWELGSARVDDYLEWAQTLRRLPELDGREMLVWTSMMEGSADVAARLPDGVTACEWGYDDWYPFGDRAGKLAAAERPFWVCPGTSSWMTILGRVANMRANCANAVGAALEHGGSGMLLTDWGDNGHLQYLPVSEPGFAYGAAVSWCRETNSDLDLAAALNVHGFDDDAGELGTAVVELGNAYRSLSMQMPNLSTLVLHLYFPQLPVGRGATNGVTGREFEAVVDVLGTALDRLRRARPRRPDGDLVIAELANAAALVAVLCRDAIVRLGADGTLASLPEGIRRELASDLDAVIASHRDVWLARNRPGGLDDSVAWLENLRRAYETGQPDPHWGGW